MFAEKAVAQEENEEKEKDSTTQVQKDVSHQLMQMSLVGFLLNKPNNNNHLNISEKANLNKLLSRHAFLH